MNEGTHGVFGVVRLGADKAAGAAADSGPLRHVFRRGLVSRLDWEPNWATKKGILVLPLPTGQGLIVKP